MIQIIYGGSTSKPETSPVLSWLNSLNFLSFEFTFKRICHRVIFNYYIDIKPGILNMNVINGPFSEVHFHQRALVMTPHENTLTHVLNV